MNELKFGADESVKSITDIYAHQLTDMAYEPLQNFAIEYTHPQYNQKQIGICTGADMIDMAEKIFGIPFSMRFQYTTQKKKYDFNTMEGSSILNACKVGKTFGFLPLSFDTDGNNVDKSHAEYINKEYTPAQYAEALKYKLSAYALVALDPLNFAIALQRSKYGLMTRMSVGDNFYRPSWDKNDLQPLRAPNPVTSGHSIKVIAHEGLDEKQSRLMRNTWGGFGNPTIDSGVIWADDGNLKYIYETQKPYVTEAYMVFAEPVTFKHIFLKSIPYKSSGVEVVALQRILINLGFLVIPTGVALGYYGDITKNAVLKYQLAKNIPQGNGMNCGPRTIQSLNENQ